MNPKSTKYNAPDIANDLANLRGSWQDESHAPFIWFDKVEGNYLFKLQDLSSIADLRQSIRVADGNVYHIKRDKNRLPDLKVEPEPVAYLLAADDCPVKRSRTYRRKVAKSADPRRIDDLNRV